MGLQKSRMMLKKFSISLWINLVIKPQKLMKGQELTDEEMQGALDAVADYFEQQNNRTEDITTKVNLVLIEMQFYGYKGQPEAIIKAAEGF